MYPKDKDNDYHPNHHDNNNTITNTISARHCSELIVYIKSLNLYHHPLRPILQTRKLEHREVT